LDLCRDGLEVSLRNRAELAEPRAHILLEAGYLFATKTISLCGGNCFTASRASARRLRHFLKFFPDARVRGAHDKLGFVFHLRDMSEENL
jgi:hypothetical protein